MEPPRPQPPPAAYPYRIDRCPWCHAKVIEAVTKNLRKMLVDPPVDPAGTVHLTPQAGRPPIAIVLVAPEKRAGKEMRMVHYATCPADHRRRLHGTVMRLRGSVMRS